jgi:nucleoside-diphosphate-sugar epimerase
MRNVLVIGGAGYVGCVLVPMLLDKGHRVTVFDIMYFGDEGLPRNPNLKIVAGDMRDIPALKAALKGIDAVIHLACISNDPSFELDPALSKSINYDCFEPLVVTCKQAGVKRFVYASTSSVYGVSDAPEVTEEHPLVPLTDYNKYKGLSEPLLLKHIGSGFEAVIIRPATVCGYSPRMRLDLSVNILTNLAFNTGKISVFGGSQMRPNIHIDDVSRLYADLLDFPAEKINGQTFNFGFENHTIASLAEMVKDVVESEYPEKGPIKIETVPSNDLRSYHVSSKKILKALDYGPKKSVRDAIRDLCAAFKAGKLPNSLNDPKYFNIKTMKAKV